jgi:hypothetical protein
MTKNINTTQLPASWKRRKTHVERAGSEMQSPKLGVRS